MPSSLESCADPLNTSFSVIENPNLCVIVAVISVSLRMLEPLLMSLNVWLFAEVCARVTRMERSCDNICCAKYLKIRPLSLGEVPGMINGTNEESEVGIDIRRSDAV